MCGITGVWSTLSTHDALASRIQAMTDALLHRGPDMGGIWVDDVNSLAIGHRRLSIHDLSDAGSQPMRSANGAMVIAFNGEIYNFDALRADLIKQGVCLKSTSDTEVLLELLVRDGVAETLPRLEGMFAFALWDNNKRTLTLVRDAYGKKPLLYQLSQREVRFASELGAFLVDPKVPPPQLDDTAAFLMLSFGVVPEPLSIIEGVGKLPPGHVLDIHMGDNGALTHRLWKWRRAVEGVKVNADRPLEQFEELLTSAVSLRLQADVPVGAFLSGGIDSSLVASHAQGLLSGQLKTFTVGFETEGFDESEYAATVAKHLGTEHHALRLSGENMEESCLAASSWFDEPFGDASAIPTRVLSAYARDFVTVALTGDGGDETFLGYPLHRNNTWLVSVLAALPTALRRSVAKSMKLVPGIRTEWWETAFSQNSPGEYYLSQRTGGFSPKPRLVMPIMSRLPPLEARSSDAEWLAACDLNTYLVDDMLTKLDRASMSVGLEARSPLLDQRIGAFSQALPLKHKIRGGVGKVLLREALKRRFPAALFQRRKSGFRAPIGVWLNRPCLRDWSREHAEQFDLRFGWRTEAGLDARGIWNENESAPIKHGRDLWRICQLMDWSMRNGI